MELTNQWYYYPSELGDDVCKNLISLGGSRFQDAHIDDRNREYSPEERISGAEEVKAVNKSRRSSEVAWTSERWVYDLIFKYLNDANEKSGWDFYIRSAANVQITRYNTGDFYKFHTDGRSDNLSTYDMPDNALYHGNVRKLSMSILLNEDFDGGKFQFAGYRDGECTIENPSPEFKKTGSILIFPSCMEHRVTEVTSGTRYSLIAWFLGPPFK